MTLLLVLKKDQPELARAEALASVYGWNWHKKKINADDSVLLIPRARKCNGHLAYTQFVSKHLATTTPAGIEEAIKKINWEKVIGKKSFAVRKTNLTGTTAKTSPETTNERAIATLIHHRLKNPHVDFQHPELLLDLITTRGHIYLGIRQWSDEEDYQGRRPHLRPALHPTGLHPRLARAMVNLAGANKIDDPFCGSGGILIEAGLAHKIASGGDNDPEMIVRARKNFHAFGLHPTLRLADATQTLVRTKAIVTDPPYSLNTKKVALAPLLEAFFILAAAKTRKIVICLPDFAHGEKLIPKQWKIRAKFRIYIHKSLTRELFVLEKS